MNFSLHLFVAVALVIVAHGNGWTCTPPPKCSRNHAFFYDDSELRTRLSSIRQEIQQSCRNQTDTLQNEIQQLQQICHVSALVTEVSQLREEIRMLNNFVNPPIEMQ